LIASFTYLFPPPLLCSSLDSRRFLFPPQSPSLCRSTVLPRTVLVVISRSLMLFGAEAFSANLLFQAYNTIVALPLGEGSYWLAPPPFCRHVAFPCPRRWLGFFNLLFRRFLLSSDLTARSASVLITAKAAYLQRCCYFENVRGPQVTRFRPHTPPFSFPPIRPPCFLLDCPASVCFGFSVTLPVLSSNDGKFSPPSLKSTNDSAWLRDMRLS